MKMKPLLSIIIIACGLQSCKLHSYKPFIITNKNPDGMLWRYQYVTGNGNYDWFTDSANKYNVGDTIK